MSLATSPLRFTRVTHNYTATPRNDNAGTSFTAATGGGYGTTVDCISALAHSVQLLRVRFGGVQLTGNDVNSVGNLMIDPSGGTSYTTTVITDLVCGFTNGAGAGSPSVYEFPVRIPSGASIGWKAKTNAASDVTTGFIVVEAIGHPTNPAMCWAGAGVETIGASGARGTAVTPGNSGAAGTWTNVGSTTSHVIKALVLGVNGSDSAANSAWYHFEVGYGSTVLPGSSIVPVNLTTTELGYHLQPPAVTCSIPAGTQLQVRATCNTTAETFYVCLYGIY